MSVAGETRRSPVGDAASPDGWGDLLRTAYLLTADHGLAEELAVAALVRAGRRPWWSRWRPAPDARRLVLTLPASPPWRARGRRTRPAPEREDPFLRAYRSLPARGRALLVL